MQTSPYAVNESPAPESPPAPHQLPRGAGTFLESLRNDERQHVRVFVAGKGMDGILEAVLEDYIILKDSKEKLIKIRTDRIDDYVLENPSLKDL